MTGLSDSAKLFHTSGMKVVFVLHRFASLTATLCQMVDPGASSPRFLFHFLVSAFGRWLWAFHSYYRFHGCKALPFCVFWD